MTFAFSPVQQSAYVLLKQWGIQPRSSDAADSKLVDSSRSASSPCPIVCVVGAGGKTTTTFALAAAFASMGLRTVVTTTTKMGHDQTGGLRTASPDAELLRAAFASDPTRPVRIAIHNDPTSPKVTGPSVEWIDAISLSGDVGAIVIEADGARRKNAKAPGPMEPVFPSLCTHIVAVLGADAINRVIEDQGHRPMRIAAAAGCAPYDRLTPERAAHLLISEIGGRKGHNIDRQWAALITQVTPHNRVECDDVVATIRRAGYFAFTVDLDPTARGLVRPSSE